MTDNYGSDNHEHDAAEHDQHMTEGQEAWHGDQAPVDDFADHHGDEPMHEDVASVSEETEIHEDVGDAEMPVEKKSSKLPLMAGAGLLLILGAGLYWQFGMSHGAGMNVAQNRPPISTLQRPPATNPYQPSVTAQPPAASKPVASPIETANNEVAPTTALVTPPAPAPTAIGAQQSGSALPAETSPSTPAMAPQTTTNSTPTPTPIIPAPVAAPATVMPAPIVPVTPVVTPTPAANSGATSVTADARLNTLSAKVDDIQKSLEDTTQKLSQLTTILSNQVNAAAAPNAAVDDRLNKIEQQLMQLNNKNNPSTPHLNPPGTNTGNAAPAPAVDMLSNGVLDKPVAPMAAASTSHHTATHKHHIIVAKAVKAHHTATVAKATAQPTPLAAVSHEPLVLRAATPNEAWVARDSTTSELRHVQVGDSLPNIGTIVGIHQTGGNWVIEGTQGTLH